MVMAHSEDPFYLVRADVLPEAIQKTIEAKRMLETGEAHTVQEAVEKAGISRSSFYKYRDSVFPFNAMMKEKIITLSLTLEHRSGVLSSVLGYLASLGCNVLTIHQTIPLQGVANVALSVDTAQVTKRVTEITEGLQELPGVRSAILVASGE
jgi:chorismate mutase